MAIEARFIRYLYIKTSDEYLQSLLSIGSPINKSKGHIMLIDVNEELDMIAIASPILNKNNHLKYVPMVSSLKRFNDTTKVSMDTYFCLN